MMSVEALRQSLPEFARDVRLNLGALLGSGGLPDLLAAQIWGSALAAAIAARIAAVIHAAATVFDATPEHASSERGRPSPSISRQQTLSGAN